jgi:hypothetical protein
MRSPIILGLPKPGDKPADRKPPGKPATLPVPPIGHGGAEPAPA